VNKTIQYYSQTDRLLHGESSFHKLGRETTILSEVAMTTIKYSVGVDIAASTFTVAVGEIPWKVVVKPQTFENTEDGYQTC
jgi:hypothetical protein